MRFLGESRPRAGRHISRRRQTGHGEGPGRDEILGKGCEGIAQVVSERAVHYEDVDGRH